jgi:rhodanese-related sulfurtransferase
MAKHIVFLLVLTSAFPQVLAAKPRGLAELLTECGTNLDKLQSWRMECEILSESRWGDRPEQKRFARFDLRFDGAQACNRGRTWAEAPPPQEVPDIEEASYMSLLWDGQICTKYSKMNKDDHGLVMIDDMANAPETTRHLEIGSILYQHQASRLMGYSPGTFDRIDKVLHEAKGTRLRPKMESINGIKCHVIDTETGHGNYTVWLDPTHGYSVARREVHMDKAEGHLWRGRAMQFDSLSEIVEIVRFDQIDNVWIGTEAIQQSDYITDDELDTTTAHIRVTKFIIDPDHEALASFEPKDIPNGTLVIVVPVTHIRYLWEDGDLVTHIDEDILAKIDQTLGAMSETDDQIPPTKAIGVAADSTSVTATPDRNKETTSIGETALALDPRPHCGLYCLYSVLRLDGQDIDYRELVKPEYYGRLRGSSLAELNRAATDYGLYAGVATRLSTRALRKTPYQAILHLKAGAEQTEYDHYGLFLGTENGKARIYSPPETPRLVSFAELASQWDGYALFVSKQPFDIDSIFTSDRQRLFLCGAAGTFIVLLGHFAKQLWLSVVGAMPRRWTLGLTAGQAAALGLAALLFGGLYHFAHDEGLLANASATASVRKAHTANFIPKISAKRTRALLGTGAVFIDARLTRDYKNGHLEGAISLPVDANDALWDQTLARIPQGCPIVAYCQSTGCKFAENVALRLIEAGYEDISIFKAGWVDWVARYGRLEPAGKEVEEENARQDNPA